MPMPFGKRLKRVLFFLSAAILCATIVYAEPTCASYNIRSNLPQRMGGKIVFANHTVYFRIGERGYVATYNCDCTIIPVAHLESQCPCYGPVKILATACFNSTYVALAGFYASEPNSCSGPTGALSISNTSSCNFNVNGDGASPPRSPPTRETKGLLLSSTRECYGLCHCFHRGASFLLPPVVKAY